MAVEPRGKGPATGPNEALLQIIGVFEDEHADLIEAMRMFGISNAEYERAIRVLYGRPISTSSST